MRLNIPAVFVSGGPMESHKYNGENADLITAMVKAADTSVSDEEIEKIEACSCPGCGSCSGMFTANSMNCLTEAIGLSLPGNGTILATHANRVQLFRDAAQLIVKNALKYYEGGDDSVLPRSIATRAAFLNAMTLDIAMGGSTNTVLHLLAVANEGGVDFKMADIDRLSRHVPCLCKLSPNTQKYSIQECNRAGGILNILGELDKVGLLDTSCRRVNGSTLAEDIEKYEIPKPFVFIPVLPAAYSAIKWALKTRPILCSIPIGSPVAYAMWNTHTAKMAVWPYFSETSPLTGAL